MMNSIEEITCELLSIDSDILPCAGRLQRERAEISNTIDKVQRVFGDQPAGQRLAILLYKTLQNLVTVESSLLSVKQELRDCIQNMNK